jgi:hypothetical protein
MSLLALTAAALLSQAEPAAEPAAQPAAEPAPATAPAAVPADPAANPNAVMRGPRAPSAEELQRQLDRIRKLPPTESSEAMQDLFRKFPEAANPNAYQKPDLTHGNHGHGPELDPLALKMGALTEAEQVKHTARVVFNHIISGDARSLVLNSAYPFQLEDRRLEMPDELHKEWLKNLRSKRTDLVTLYDVEVLTPAEMEKKYGRPPGRLSNLPWKAPRTMIAIGNLSGHAAVAVFRAHPTGRWQLVGYHD